MSNEEERIRRLLSKQKMHHHYVTISDGEGNRIVIDQSSDVTSFGDKEKCDEIIWTLIRGTIIDLESGETSDGYKVEFSEGALGLESEIVEDLRLSREHLKNFSSKKDKG